MKKRILSVIISCCMLLTIFAIPVAAQDTKVMVVLGDSISTGYGLDGYSATPAPNAKGSFANIVCGASGMTAMNLAVDGLTSTQLLAGVQGLDDAQKAAIGAASAISVTIGGNDLIGALYTAMGTAMGSADKDAIIKAITAAANGDTAAAASLTAAISAVKENAAGVATAFAANLTGIITNLRALNKTAPILVQTIANPYSKLTDAALVGAIDTGVTALNTAIKAGETTGAYKVIDVYSAFQASTDVLTNATNPATPLDPHPNASGHAVIASLYTTLLVPPTATTPAATGVDTSAPSPLLVTASSIIVLLVAAFIAFTVVKKNAKAK